MITNHEADVLAHTSNTGRYMARRGLLNDHGGYGL